MNNNRTIDAIFERDFYIEVEKISMDEIEEWMRQTGTFKSLQELRMEKRRKKLNLIMEKIKK